MRCIFNATTFFQLKMNIYFRLQSHSRQNFINIESDVDHKKGGQGGFEPPTSRTQSENHTPRPLALNGELNLEGFEPPTFGSGIRRAAIAP